MTVAISNTSLDYVKNNNKKDNIKYPKTYVGTAIGAAMAISSVVSASNYRNLFKSQSKLNKTVASAYAFVSAVMILPGVLIDYCTNKKRKEFAIKTAGMNEKEALKQDKNAYVTQKLNPYIKSNAGKKLGSAFGALYSALLVLPALSKSHLSVRSILGMSTAAASVGALGGLALGFLNDSIANSKVEKQVDKIYG